MGFANEKDHPEVAPSQFEMNYSYTEATVAADQVQLYKLLSRQVAARMEMTACFLPKPVTGVNGNGMHTNVSLARKGKNLFFDKKGQDGLTALGWNFIERILANANDICLFLNPSVNSYRRLDPHFEAPNQIKASAIDRGSMVRIPLGNEKSARVEVRSIAPDANPYLAIYSVIRTGIEGPLASEENDGKRPRTRFLPDNIYDGIRLFKGSRWAMELIGEEVHGKYADLKLASAERCPKALGTRVKRSEIQFHHEVTNQYLWNSSSEEAGTYGRRCASGRRQKPLSPPSKPSLKMPGSVSNSMPCASQATCSGIGPRRHQVALAGAGEDRERRQRVDRHSGGVPKCITSRSPGTALKSSSGESKSICILPGCGVRHGQRHVAVPRVGDHLRQPGGDRRIVGDHQPALLELERLRGTDLDHRTRPGVHLAAIDRESHRSGGRADRQRAGRGSR